MKKIALFVLAALVMAGLSLAFRSWQEARSAVEPLSLAPLDQWIDTHNLSDNRAQVYYYFTYSFANCVGSVVQTGCGGDIGSYWSTYRVYQSQTCKEMVLPAFPNAWHLYAYVNLFSTHNIYEGDDFSPRLELVLPCLTWVYDNNGRKYNLYPDFLTTIYSPYP